ncbi:MAG TPA: glycosyltransferase family 39 protein [Solirubrobacterales bacterium]|jgi:4-amino-4-deoxy-L-arabinose transferase-like glycosyltransferase|nr:glycosyltransferase family 39 protein [Solirubrobacterales bacterium]
MEAAGALRRSSFSTYLESISNAVRARSRTFWIVVGLTVLAGALRFATLGVQSYHHDEIVTASRILRDGFWHAMDAVGFSESAPPLYYAVAWLWTQVTGTGEFGLRSVSAVAGVATVPVAYLLGAELSNRRAGIVAAALVAVNPMLLWYSQEARAYALFVLLTAISLLYFVRALDRGRRRDSLAWGIASALALGTHYFAAFPIAAEALWLLRRRGREAGGAFPGIWIVAVAGLLLTPLLLHQSSFAHAEWISNFSLWHRLWETGLTFALGETGDIIAQPEHPLLAVVPALIAIAGVWLVFARGERAERRAAGIPLALAAVTVVAPLAIGLLDPSKDYVLARNLLPALVPLLVALAVGFTLRGARRSGAVLAGLLVAYSLGFSIWASVSPALQRPDWDSVASAIGEPTVPRAMVTWKLGEASLRYYLSTGSIQVQPSDGFRWWVGEIDFISDGKAPPPPARLFGSGFREVGYERVGRLYVRRFATPGSELRPLRLRTVRNAKLGFRTNGVLLDGIGPG